MRAILLVLGMTLPAFAEPVSQGRPNASFKPEWPTQTRAPEQRSGIKMQLEVLASGLERPWGIAVLPDGGFLITERPGRLRLLTSKGLSAPISGVPQVDARGQGGLLDVAVSDKFAEDRLVYLTYAKPRGGGLVATAAAQGKLSSDGAELTEVKELFVQHPPSPTPMHFGSRIVLRGDEVFITTGEHSARQESILAQDMATTYGKIIRILGDADPEIWTLGHRNIQGAALRGQELWAVEHGPRGGDELNRIEQHANYGWPVVSYGINYNGSDVGNGIAVGDGFTPPRYYWDPVIAPGGMVFYRGDMFDEWTDDALIGSLNPGGLVRVSFDGDVIINEERFWSGEFRLRDVAIDHDGALLLLDDSNGRVLRAVRQ